MSANKLLLAVLALVTAMGLVASPARAQEAVAAAQALFDDAKRLMGEQRYDEACPKLAESNRLDPGTGTLLNLGVCYEQAGKTGSAWSAFKQAQLMGRREGREDRVTFAAAGIARLEPRLSRLTVSVPPAARVAGLVVTRDGLPISEATFGSPLPVDPGTHQVIARAPKHEQWAQTVVVGEAADHETIQVPALVPSPVAPPLAPTPRPTSPPGPAQEGDDGATQRTAGFVVAGIGGAATAAGLVFGGLAISAESDADELCGDGAVACPTQEGRDATDSAHRSATLANGFTFGGLGLVAVGLTVALLAPSEPAEPQQQAAVYPWLGPAGGGMAVELSW